MGVKELLFGCIVRTKEAGFGGLKTELLNILIGFFIYFLIPFTFVSEKSSFAIV